MTPFVRYQWLRVVTTWAAPLYVRIELADFLRASGDHYLVGLGDHFADPMPRVPRRKLPVN